MHVTDSPPSYEEANASSSMSAAMTYIVKHPARGPPPADIVEYDLPLFSTGTPLRFPTPEHVWTSRDVDHEDWSAFSEQLGLRDTADEDPDLARPAGESDAARRRRINYVVDEWNAEFFRPRGLRVHPVFDEGMPAESDAKGFGFKAGNSFVGVSLPPHSNGYGLRLPGGILIGVASTKDKEEQK